MGVAVWMRASLQGLPVGLQAVAQFMEQFGHHAMTGLMALPLQLLGQPPHTLAGPPQRRLRVSSSGRFHQPLQILTEARVLLHRALAPSSGPPDTALFGPQVPRGIPWRMVPGAAPVALATAACPPRPIALTSAARNRRRIPSSIVGASARYRHRMAFSSITHSVYRVNLK